LFSGAPAASTAAEQAAYIEMARQAALEELAAMSGPTATGAGLAAGVGPAAPSIEAGLVEMLGPELAAELGYTAAPVAAGVGAGLAAGGAAGAELLPMAAGSLGAEGLGLTGASAVAAPAAALAVPLIVKQIIESLSLGGNFKPAYDYSANSLVPKVATYEAAQLGREIPALPAMDQLAAADAIAAKIGFGGDAYQAARAVETQLPGYGNARPQIAQKLAEIMVRENRYPTQKEFLLIAGQAVNTYAMTNWENTIAGQQSEGKSTIDMGQPPRLLDLAQWS